MDKLKKYKGRDFPLDPVGYIQFMIDIIEIENGSKKYPIGSSERKYLERELPTFYKIMEVLLSCGYKNEFEGQK